MLAMQCVDLFPLKMRRKGKGTSDSLSIFLLFIISICYRDSEQQISYPNKKKRKSPSPDYDYVEVDLTRKFKTQLPREEIGEIIDLDLGNKAALESITIVDHAELDISFEPDDDDYPPLSEAEIDDFFSDFEGFRVKGILLSCRIL